MTLNVLPAAMAASFATSLLLIWWIIRIALRRNLLLDAPNERSSHKAPKPRGGGLGVVGGFGIGCLMVFVVRGLDSATLILIAGALACTALGLWDDLRGLSIRPRLAVEVAIAAWLVYETGPVSRVPLPPPLDVPLGPLGYLFPVIWIVGVTNFFNFMDGIDGLAAGQAAAVCLAVAGAAWSHDAVMVASVLLAALLGFLRFNWWPSRIFLGDAGSLPVGFVLAGLPLLAPSADRPRAVLATAIGLTLFLLDPVQTLWRRWRRGAPLGQSHREHIYQQFLAPGDPHGRVALILVSAGLLLSAAGVLAYHSPALAWWAVLFAGLVFGIECHLGRRRAHH